MHRGRTAPRVLASSRLTCTDHVFQFHAMELAPLEPHVLNLLDALELDPSATVHYEWLSGGLVWSDELPRDEAARRVVTRSHAFKYVLAYRASVTVGKERAEFRPHWEQVQTHAPHWPGLQPDRRNDEARSRLLASAEAMTRELENLG